MGASRRLLLALSASTWLRARAPRWWFVRKAAARFMPGESLDDACEAARDSQARGIGVVLTQLGENVTDAAAADAVLRHYMDVLAAIHDRGLSGEISVKPTQLGLDVDLERCYRNLRTLVEHAHLRGTHVWIDMEQHAYLERTLALYRRLVSEFPNTGVCLQAYLRRTGDDLQSLLPLGGGIRLVKGAYREAADLVFPKKHDVDSRFIDLAARMLAAAGLPTSPRLVFGTHDRAMIDAIVRKSEQAGIRRDAFEFHLLFGIQRAEQMRLSREGYRVRVLISYGDQWFAWYMRRLAERPANVLFAIRAMFS
jgi:proline dehydrogenase